ncbi:hypothetical protein D9758_009112 [Tetrapyrgos nigripes]|uniref:Uncharacterized protein n=1 Tax=Tetrapyrgos nigripes TaxID=182062 RepID=A0A8H5LKA1_9AGAR|nr:hypothetical protein D9758_009112 [Tetrapyrgos nigripes]
MGIRALYHLSEKSDLSFPILEEFTFEPTREYWFGQESFMLGNVFKLPRLSSLKFLLNSCFHFESFDSFPFPLSNLKHLHLYACHRDAMDLRELLRACPLLETCNLIAVPNFKVAGIENDLPTDEFPHLRHLTLKFGGIIGSPGFLNGVRLPALEKLDLHLPKYFAPEPDEDDNHPHILPYLTSLHDRAPFPLRELTLAYCVHDKAADIVTFLKRFNSTLQTLNLDDCKLDVPVFCGALRATTECKVPLPNLTKISITQTQEEEYYDLDDPEEAGFDHPRETDIIIADMVLSRWRPYADDEDVVDKDTEIGKEVASRSKKGGKKKVGRGKGKGKVKGTTETSIPTTKWPVAKLTRGFTFLTYHRDLEEEAMAKLNECKEEGMPLEVDWGKIPDYDSGH